MQQIDTPCGLPKNCRGASQTIRSLQIFERLHCRSRSYSNKVILRPLNREIDRS
ncbi:MAG: hypothetical protein ACP5N0_08765 [Methanosarcina sp.]